jgi:hypothetical protein
VARTFFNDALENHMQLLRELFVYNATSGMDVASAHKRTLLWAASEVSGKVANGEDLKYSLDAFGFHNVEKLSGLVNTRREFGSNFLPKIRIEDHEQTALFRHPVGPALFLIVTDPDGGVGGIPTPSCIESHLPKNRKPTADELRAAWKACLNG